MAESGWASARPPRSSRGYGWMHVKLRNKWKHVIAQGRTPCWRCTVIIRPNEEWHLGHDDEGNYKGPEHKECNLKAASKRAHEIRNSKNPLPAPQTKW